MDNQKKILTRIQLVNWHYFENETISINGSTLISGENTAGKSTILDAIQLVLTTNSRKFNMAANERSNRDLRGYVRCKIGNIGESYLRKNVVPGNVALEFYEEKDGRYFVIGVHLLSPDEESPVKKSWYVEDDCRLEQLSFIIDGTRPALPEEFRRTGKRLRFIDTDRAAKDYFKRRLGNLDDKFFDIIPKSLAFKPMDNVKDFINKFVLSEDRIDIKLLQENIETLSELELLLERSKKQYEKLGEIVDIYEKVVSKEHDIKVNDLLLDIAKKNALQEDITKEQAKLQVSEQSKESIAGEISKIEVQKEDIEQQILSIKVAIESNSANRMVETLQRQLDDAKKQIMQHEQSLSKLNEQVDYLRAYERSLLGLGYTILTAQETHVLSQNTDQSNKDSLLAKITHFQDNEYIVIEQEAARCRLEMEQLTNRINELMELLKELERHNLRFPDNTTKLKKLIEDEFVRRHIDSKVYILCELLEISDPAWADAVEGYFDRQKFYLVVEPEAYDVALQVYARSSKDIFSAGIINTKKLPMQTECPRTSLAYVVNSENRYAKAYVNYILGRVIRCDKVEELENHDISITTDCMLYQGYVVRKIDPKRYVNPYIGQHAYRVQIVNTKYDIEKLSNERQKLREQSALYNDALQDARRLNLTLLRMNIAAPLRLAEAKEHKIKLESELEAAMDDPTLIELRIQLSQKEKEREGIKQEQKRLADEENRLIYRINKSVELIDDWKSQHKQVIRELNAKEDADGAVYKAAFDRFQSIIKRRSSRQITEIYAPKKSQLENEKERLVDLLKDKQRDYNTDFTQDFVVGLTGISEYIMQREKLRTVEMIQHEEKLRVAKEDCEHIFRSDFLSKMKELIENARMEFKNLNKALDNIYYGDDSYHFTISSNKNKAGLYKMITSENNQEGTNLWTQAFEEQYHDEMAELFDKLMTKDDNGKKIVEEYTDYRTYLDYDIEIHKRDGSIQRFSDIYGEKSGSETQVPYYVAIAASFYQLYRFGNSVRIMLLDEAFDKMDDDRIGSMMEFFNGLELQVIMATPPAKIEVIGERVKTILTAIRTERASIVEEYDL